MTADRHRTQSILSLIKQKFSVAELIARQAPKYDLPLTPSIRPTKNVSLTALENYWKILLGNTAAQEADKAVLANGPVRESLELFQNNIENCIGAVHIPVGVIGPLRVNGIFAQGDYYVPLATTEATLVASHGRGARLISECGGCTVALLNDGLSRTPVYAFKTITESGLFAQWISDSYDMLKKAAESTTRYGKLIDLHTHIEGNHVYLTCEYMTGDAAGQNMTTIATQELCQLIEKQSPVKPDYWFLESNFSGDKKASSSSFFSVRGKKVSAEILIPAALVEKYLHTTIQTMDNYWRISALGGVMSGTIGVQGHYANGLAALYLATGQDAACVSESSVGITRMEIRDDNLYVSVTLPNVVVGTVGGGTKLPGQSAGLNILGLKGAGHVHALAEVCAALCLAGELSLIGAICAGQFAGAHQKLARGIYGSSDE